MGALPISDELARRFEQLPDADRASLVADVERFATEQMKTISPKIDRTEFLARAKEIAAMTPKGVVQTPSEILLREDRDR